MAEETQALTSVAKGEAIGATSTTSQPASGATLPGLYARYPVEIEAINVSQAFLFSRTDNYNLNNVFTFFDEIMERQVET